MRIKLNSGFQRAEVDYVIARFTASQSDRIGVGATYAIIPDDMVDAFLHELEVSRAQVQGNNRGRANAIASVKRAIAAART